MSGRRPGLAPALYRVVDRALAKDPGDRFPDAAAMAEDLRAGARATAAPRPREATRVLPVRDAAPPARDAALPAAVEVGAARDAAAAAVVEVGAARERAEPAERTGAGRGTPERSWALGGAALLAVLALAGFALASARDGGAGPQPDAPGSASPTAVAVPAETAEQVDLPPSPAGPSAPETTATPTDPQTPAGPPTADPASPPDTAPPAETPAPASPAPETPPPAAAAPPRAGDLPGLIDLLADDPEAYGESGPELLDGLEKVEGERGGKQRDEARKARDDIAGWLEDGELDPVVAQAALAALDPIAGPPGRRDGRVDEDDDD